MTEPTKTKLCDVRARLDDASVLARCSARGAILEVDSDPGVDESLIGDVVASAANLASQASELVVGDDITTLVIGKVAAIASRRLRDGTWASMLVTDPSSVGLAVEALASIEI